MAIADLHKLNDEELVHTELQLERDLLAASFRLRTGQLDDTASVGRVRKDIARARTVQREREREQGLPKDSLRTRHRPTFSAKASEDQPTAGSGGFLKGIVDKIGGNG